MDLVPSQLACCALVLPEAAKTLAKETLVVHWPSMVFLEVLSLGDMDVLAMDIQEYMLVFLLFAATLHLPLESKFDFKAKLY